MQVIKEEFSRLLNQSLDVLLSNGVLVVPTETVYGIVTLWGNKAGRERIYAMKHRPKDKRLQMLVSSLNQAHSSGVVISPALECLSARFWPGPLTVIVKSTEEEDGTVGVRMPANGYLQALLDRLPEPLAATSANLSGLPPATTALEAVSALDGEPDLLVDGGEPTQTAGRASTVVSLLGDKPVILREGVITLTDINTALYGDLSRRNEAWHNEIIPPDPMMNIVELPRELVEEVKARRKRYGISVERLAKYLNIDTSTIRKWERFAVNHCLRSNYDALIRFLSEENMSKNMHNTFFQADERLAEDATLPKTTGCILKELVILLRIFRSLPDERMGDGEFLSKLRKMRQWAGDERPRNSLIQ